MYNTIIIGGGLGGLASGAILAQQGMHVCVLEQHTQAGGCLQSFTREGDTFDTGFHCVGGLRPGEVLYPFFRALRLLDLPWLRMDESAFEEVILGDKNYFIAQGYRRFIKTLAHEFPHEEAGLRTFVKMLRSVGQTLPKLFDEEETARRRTRKLFSLSAYDFLHKTIHDPQLRRVIAGASLKMEPQPYHSTPSPRSTTLSYKAPGACVAAACRSSAGSSSRSKPPEAPSAPTPESHASSANPDASPPPSSLMESK